MRWGERFDDAIEIALRRQRNRSGNLGTRLLGGIDDETRGLIHDLVVIALEANANLLISYFLLPPNMRAVPGVRPTQPPALLIISSATFLGTGSYESNCMV